MRRSWRSRAWLKRMSTRRDERRGLTVGGGKRRERGGGYKRENMAGRKREVAIDEKLKASSHSAHSVPMMPKNIPKWQKQKTKKKKF